MIPAFKSCTSFIAMIGEQRFGFNPAPVAELVHWTDIIDGALYRRRQNRGGNEGSGHEADHGHRILAGPRLLFRA